MLQSDDANNANNANNANTFSLEHCFGPAQWAGYFGDVGPCPALPDNTDALMLAPCPIWPGKQVWQTHKLFLAPQAIDGEPLSLDRLGAVIERPRQGYPAHYLYFSSYVKADIGAHAGAGAHWCLMTMDVVPGSRSMDYQDQRRLMAAMRGRLDLPYTLPTTLEAALCILTHHVATGERIFARDDMRASWTITRCEDAVSSDNWAVAVGGFEEKGLLLYRSPDFLFDRHFTGTAAIRRL